MKKRKKKQRLDKAHNIPSTSTSNEIIENEHSDDCTSSDDGNVSNLSESIMQFKTIPQYEIPITDEFIVSGRNFDTKCKSLKWETCSNCPRKYFDLEIANGLCQYCKNPKKKEYFTAENNMDPGPLPDELKNLTQIEKMLIAQIYPILSLYRQAGNQYKYSGHVINFIQNIEDYVEHLPPHPSKIKDFVVFIKKVDGANFEFKARASFLRKALIWLKNNNPYYQHIDISEENLNEYSEDGDITNFIPNLEIDDEDFKGFHDNITHDSFVPYVITKEPDEIIQTELKLSYPSISNDPINEFTTEGLLARAFPALFPYGDGDINQARNFRIGHYEYFKYLMQYKDRRFAEDPRFRFYCLNFLMRHEAITQSRLFVKKSVFHSNDANVIQNMLTQNKSLMKSIYVVGKNIKGTRSFWRQKYYELLSMVTQIGTPNLFFTLTAADNFWPALYKLLLNEHQQDHLTTEQKNKLIRDNPDVVSFFFQKRTQLFINHVLVKIFPVKEYWYRYEWQHRGSTHAHGLLWLDNAPSIDDNEISDEMLNNFCMYYDNFSIAINYGTNKNDIHPSSKYFSEIPQKQYHHDLSNLLMHFQQHTKCGRHCLRKTGNKLICRYQFPKELVEKSYVEKQERSLIFHPKRNDPLLQRYNPYVTMIWRANTDMTAILSIHAVLAYIAKYVAKDEKSSADFNTVLEQFHKNLEHSSSVTTAVTKFLMNMISERDFSAQEVSHILMGYNLTGCSKKFVLILIPTDETIQLKRDNKSKDVLIAKENALFSTYKNRKLYLNLSLMEFAKTINVHGKKLYKAEKENVVRVIPHIDKKVNEDNEHWYRQQCILHIPFHGDNGIKNLKRNIPNAPFFKTGKWEKVYVYNHLNIEEIQIRELINSDVTPAASDEQMTRAQFEMCSTYSSKRLLKTLGGMAKDLSFDWVNNSKNYSSITEIENFLKNYKSQKQNQQFHSQQHIQFVNEQLEVLNIIDQQINYMKSTSLKAALQDNSSKVPRRLVIQGKAGSGKSTLIHEIARKIISEFGAESIMITAPTGAAAVNIGGRTIHSALRLGIHKKLEMLSPESARKFENEHSQRFFIIIDEMSMLGASKLYDIHRRCLQMKPGCQGPFANMFIILVGDFNQLPPVQDTPLYDSGSSNKNVQSGRSIFKTFEKHFKLSISHRQSSNVNFSSLCDRLAIKQLTIDDYKLLCTRKLVTASKIEKVKFTEAMRLFPKNPEVEDYNKNLLANVNHPIATLKSKTEPNIKEIDDEIKSVLPDELHIYIGCRVMLRENVWTEGGLINGSLGNVTGLVYKDGTELPALPEYVLIKFDNYSGPHINESFPIKRSYRSWMRGNIKITRIQFALQPAYASTIHKSQGLTISQTVIDLTPQSFAPNLAYTGITRVRTLNNMLISNLPTLSELNKISNPNKFKMKLDFLKKLEKNKFKEI